MSGSILNRVFEFASILLLTAYLTGAGDFGSYTTIFIYLSFWAQLVNFGSYSILRRECARDRENAARLMATGFTIGVCSSLAAILLSYAVLHYIHYSEEVKNLFWYGVFALVVSSRIKSLRKLFEVMFIVDFRVAAVAALPVLDRFLFMGCLFVFIRGTHSLQDAVLLTVLVDSAGFILMTAFYVRRYGRIRVSFDPSRLKFILNESWPMLLTAFMNIIYLRIGILIMSGLLDKWHVGVYRMGTLIPESLSFIPVAFTTPIFQILSKKYTINREAYFNVYRTMLKYLMFIVFPIVVYLFVELDEVMNLLVSLNHKPDYLFSIPPARILLVSELFIFSFMGFSVGLTSSNNQRYKFAIIVMTSAMSVILSYVMILKFNMIGAAYATVVSYGLFIVTGSLIPVTRPFVKEVIRASLKPGAAGVITGVLLYFLNLNMWISIAATGILYTGIFYLMRGFSVEDYEFFYEAFPTKFVRWLIKRENS